MKQALREALGKAAYAGRVRFYAEVVGMKEFDEPPLEEQGDEIRELYKMMGEEAVMAFCGLIAPLAQLAVNLLDQVFDAEEIERLAATPLDLDRLRYDEHKEPA